MSEGDVLLRWLSVFDVRMMKKIFFILYSFSKVSQERFRVFSKEHAELFGVTNKPLT